MMGKYFSPQQKEEWERYFSTLNSPPIPQIPFILQKKRDPLEKNPETPQSLVPKDVTGVYQQLKNNPMNIEVQYYQKTPSAGSDEDFYNETEDLSEEEIDSAGETEGFESKNIDVTVEVFAPDWQDGQQIKVMKFHR
jgi:hypothetical protein